MSNRNPIPQDPVFDRLDAFLAPPSFGLHDAEAWLYEEDEDPILEPEEFLQELR